MQLLPQLRCLYVNRCREFFQQLFHALVIGLEAQFLQQLAARGCSLRQLRQQGLLLLIQLLQAFAIMLYQQSFLLKKDPLQASIIRNILLQLQQ